MKRALFTLMCLAAMLTAGTGLKAQEVTITLWPGWNWISYPNAEVMQVEEALGDFVPMNGDMILSQFSNSTYVNNRWRGGVTQFMPGWGYMYYSARNEIVEFVFAQTSDVSVTTTTPTDITATSAVVGGIVTLPEGSHVFLRGVCWGTEPNPDIDGNHTSDGTDIGSFSSTLEGLNPNTIYYVRAYVVSDYGLAYGEDMNFTTTDQDYVDLGLPSGTLWATCNIGADTPEGYGDFFAWGEIQPKDGYGWNNYQHCYYDIDWPLFTKYCSKPSLGYNGYSDTLTTLLPEDDAATANWGSGWRMPTNEEWEELIENVPFTMTEQDGVFGWLFTASNGNSLFLPAAENFNFGNGVGFYWSSSLDTDYPDNAWCFSFSMYSLGHYFYFRCNGLSVRPVRSFQNTAPTGAIDGKFTINGNGDQVYFSQGNLQYIGSATTPYWKFAENQWDYLGTSTGQNSNSQTVDRDLFGWGTSGYHDPNDSGNIHYQPWSTSTTNHSVYNIQYNDFGYGPSTNMPSPNLTGSSANYDWGVYNPISNGGNAPNLWRTLSQEEWAYVFQTRNTVSGIRYAKAKVNDINGVVILPDNWEVSNYSLNNVNTSGASYNVNVITALEWSNSFENNGAVFLPAAGDRGGTHSNSLGCYYSSSYYDWAIAYQLWFSDSKLYNATQFGRCNGCCVRLVQNVE